MTEKGERSSVPDGHIDALETLDKSDGATLDGAAPGTRGAAGGRGPTLSAGRTFGAYSLRRALGRGAFGQVWEAEDLRSGRRVALKVLASSAAASEVERQRFEREGRLAASISHPNCVYVFGAEEIDGFPVIAMELVPGGTLQDLARAGGPLPAKQAVDYALDIVDGLEAAHQRGVIHRDVKPSNCFLDAEGRAKVGDFGLSRTLDVDTQLTATGAFLGTPAYASPEQVKGQDLDFRTDVYSLGASLYALLAGKAPFEGTQLGAVLSRILSEPPPSLAALKVPAGLERAVLRMMEKDREKRFPSYEALRVALVPYSSKGLTAASLAKRFAAIVVDSAVMLPVTLLAQLTPRMIGGLLAGVVYYTVLEKVRGRSIGKQVFGLQVASASGGEVTWMQILARSATYSVLIGLPMWVGLLMPEPTYLRFITSPLNSTLQLAAIAAMLSTMRRRNGFAGLHELVSGTRVTAVTEVDRAPVPDSALPLGPAGPVAVLGPYRVKGTVWEAGGEALLLAQDPVLERDVLVHRRPVSAGPATTHSSPGRLQWLQGSPEGWDAFEVPGGTSLWSWVRTRGPLTWAELQRALVTLLPEIETSGGSLSLTRVWVDGLGRGKLLDFDAERPDPAEAPPEFAPSEAGRFLHQLVLFALEARVVPSGSLAGVTPRVPLPGHARAFVEGLSTGETVRPAALAAEMARFSDRPAAINRGRRAAALSMPAAGPLMAAMVGLMWATAAGESLTAGMELRRVVRKWHETQAARPADPERRWAADVLLSHAAARAEALSAGTGGASFLRMIGGARTRVELGRLTAEETAAVGGARARHPAPTSDDLARARQLLRMRRDMSTAQLGSLMFTVMSLLTSVAGVVLALVTRGGLGLLIGGLSVSRRDGRRASHLRCAWRAIVAYAPFLVLGGLLVTGILRGPALLPAAVAVAVVSGIGAAAAIVRPTRGLHDVLAGTVLVPR